MKPNFETILIHCSSLSKLTTEPKSKEDKLAGNLSATAKSHLIEIYAEKLFDFKKELDNKYVRKGNEKEPEAIEELGMTLKLPLKKMKKHLVISTLLERLIFALTVLYWTPNVVTIGFPT